MKQLKPQQIELLRELFPVIHSVDCSFEYIGIPVVGCTEFGIVIEDICNGIRNQLVLFENINAENFNVVKRMNFAETYLFHD